jgi:hypothetical protein
MAPAPITAIVLIGVLTQFPSVTIYITPLFKPFTTKGAGNFWPDPFPPTLLKHDLIEEIGHDSLLNHE